MRRRGFTLIELVIVGGIIAILATVMTYGLITIRSRSKLARVSAELGDIAKAASQYYQDNNYSYPADVSRNVPPGLEKYLAGGVWPTSIWPHGVFDWENYTGPSNQQVIQISYHLCNSGDPDSYCSDGALFPHFTRYSSIYYCIYDSSAGTCGASSNPGHYTDPAYCVNCKVHPQNPPL